MAPWPRGPTTGAAVTINRESHDHARVAVPAALRSLRPGRAGAQRVRHPDRAVHRDLLLPAHPPAAPPGGAAQAAARLVAAGGPGRDLERHRGRGPAHQGRAGHGAERRGEVRDPAQRDRQHHEPRRRGGEAGVTVRTLHLLGSPVLRQKAKAVAQVDDAVRTLVDDLFETMRAARGVGLAANQIGVARRVAVVDVGENDPPPLVLINPVIVERGDEVAIAEEGCLSIPEIFGDVERRAHVVVEALDRDGRPYRAAADGYKARAIQHEIDHLDGILFLDHLSAVKRGLLLSKWKKARKGQTGYLKEVTPEPAGEL